MGRRRPRSNRQSKPAMTAADIVALANSPETAVALNTKWVHRNEDLSLEIEYLLVNDLTQQQKDFCFNLVEINLRDMYERTWGWKPEEKKIELFDSASRFLLVRDTVTDQYVAYVMFQFLVDEELPVSYCFEVQVSDGYRNKKIGERMIQILEMVARKNHLRFVVLTVFKENTGARRFYENKLGYDSHYEIDHDDPEEKEVPHIVLSKRLR